MTRRRIASRLRLTIIAESGGRCAYCHAMTAVTGAKMVIDHIQPLARGGPSAYENLCVACHACNEFKRDQIFARDPVSDEEAPLFHPRLQDWREHFRWSEDFSLIVGITAVGRATVEVLNMNHRDIVEARRRWTIVGWHPPVGDL